MSGSLTYQQQINILRLMALKGEGNTFQLVRVNENIEVVAKCGSRDEAAAGLSQKKKKSNVERGC